MTEMGDEVWSSKSKARSSWQNERESWFLMGYVEVCYLTTFHGIILFLFSREFVILDIVVWSVMCLRHDFCRCLFMNAPLYLLYRYVMHLFFLLLHVRNNSSLFGRLHHTRSLYPLALVRFLQFLCVVLFVTWWGMGWKNVADTWGRKILFRVWIGRDCVTLVALFFVWVWICLFGFSVDGPCDLCYCLEANFVALWLSGC